MILVYRAYYNAYNEGKWLYTGVVVANHTTISALPVPTSFKKYINPVVNPTVLRGT